VAAGVRAAAARARAAPPRQREVVDLRLNHELSHAAIAELLDIREDASRASYYQALLRLRTRFDDD
jgi:DNA-directed RNA polymerase specialized sigma24 family protein